MQFRFFGAPIQLRVLYALISSLLWWAMVEGERFLINSLWGYVSDVTGAVYAALVLIPYLPGLNGNFKLRALALLLCGVLSYWSATNFFFWLGKFAPWGMPDLILATAGIVGAVIAGIGARMLIPLSLRWSGWIMLVLAGCLGGVVLGIGFDAGFTMKNGVPNLYLLPGHITWQVLVCLALYYGSERITPPPARS